MLVQSRHPAAPHDLGLPSPGKRHQGIEQSPVREWVVEHRHTAGGQQSRSVSGVLPPAQDDDLGVFGKISDSCYERLERNRHERPSQKNQQGGIVEKEAPVHMAKLMLVDPQSDDRTRVRRQILDDGSKIRVAVKSGEQIPDND